MTISKLSDVSFTDAISGGSHTPKITVSGEDITITLNDSLGHGEESWKYTQGGLSKINFLDKKSAREAPEIIFEEDSPFTLSGRIETEADNQRLLKLSQKSTVYGGDASFCAGMLVDSIPISSEIAVPGTLEDSQFKVTISCPHSGPIVTNISLLHSEIEAASKKTKTPSTTNEYHRDSQPDPTPIYVNPTQLSYSDTLIEAVRDGNQGGAACKTFAATAEAFYKAPTPENIKIMRLESTISKMVEYGCLR